MSACIVGKVPVMGKFCVLFFGPRHIYGRNDASMHRDTWVGDTRIVSRPVYGVSRCHKRYVNACIAKMELHILSIYYVKYNI